MKVAVIGGDGIGPEVIAEAVRVLEWFRAHRGVELDLWHLDLGAERYLRDGSTFGSHPKRDCDRMRRRAAGRPR